MCNLSHIQFKLGILITVLGMVLSCLITNCPRGGKRSEGGRNNGYPDHTTVSECTSCGPENQGVCLGRSICCGKGIGCLTSPRHTKSCRNLTTFKTSCLLGLTGPACGESGYCKTNYLCCTKDQCVMDPSCRSVPLPKYRDFSEASVSAFNPLVLSVLLEKNMVEKEAPETNQNEIQRAKTDLMPYSSDYES